jgi:hypothetical protein
MTKYILEGNINFQEELGKLLDEESDNEDECCQITGASLKDKYVTLECNHHFNYEALYKEIYRQKYEFNTYDLNSLSKTDKEKFINSNLDYFIRCPYCRNLQFTVLPYYKELEFPQLYGINSLDKTLPRTILLKYPQINVKQYTNSYKYHYGHPKYEFTSFGVKFKYGQCCQVINEAGVKCSTTYVSEIPSTSLLYCRGHYRSALKMFQKKKQMEVKAKEKEDKINEKIKLLEEMNAERAALGRPPLKHLPIKKVKAVKNIVKQGQSIQDYNPEDELDIKQIGCKEILKTGLNKGNPCGCKKILDNGLCKRHSPK